VLPSIWKQKVDSGNENRKRLREPYEPDSLFPPVSPGRAHFSPLMTIAAVAGCWGVIITRSSLFRPSNEAITLRGSAVVLRGAAFCETYLDITNLKRT
jgi:hypothetical protein